MNKKHTKIKHTGMSFIVALGLVITSSSCLHKLHDSKTDRTNTSANTNTNISTNINTNANISTHVDKTDTSDIALHAITQRDSHDIIHDNPQDITQIQKLAHTSPQVLSPNVNQNTDSLPTPTPTPTLSTDSPIAHSYSTHALPISDQLPLAPAESTHTRTIIVKNTITPKMLSYKHWTGKYTPTLFSLFVNDNELANNQELPITIRNNKVDISYRYSFMKGYRTGARKITFSVDPQATSIAVTFNWKNKWHVICDHATPQSIQEIPFEK